MSADVFCPLPFQEEHLTAHEHLFGHVVCCELVLHEQFKNLNAFEFRKRNVTVQKFFQETFAPKRKDNAFEPAPPAPAPFVLLDGCFWKRQGLFFVGVRLPL